MLLIYLDLVVLALSQSTRCVQILNGLGQFDSLAAGAVFLHQIDEVVEFVLIGRRVVRRAVVVDEVGGGDCGARACVILIQVVAICVQVLNRCGSVCSYYYWR